MKTLEMIKNEMDEKQEIDLLITLLKRNDVFKKNNEELLALCFSPNGLTELYATNNKIYIYIDNKKGRTLTKEILYNQLYRIELEEINDFSDIKIVIKNSVIRLSKLPTDISLEFIKTVKENS